MRLLGSTRNDMEPNRCSGHPASDPAGAGIAFGSHPSTQADQQHPSRTASRPLGRGPRCGKEDQRARHSQRPAMNASAAKD
jgi:hypothetical protein